MIRSFLIISFLIISFQVSNAQGLEFYKEDLVLTVGEDNLVVSGKYYFCNTSSQTVRQMLFYPFPIDLSICGEVDSISITCEGNPAPVYKTTEAGLQFGIKLEPYKSKCCDICYRQLLFSTRAEYILLTTQKWHKPLTSASYTIILHEGIALDSLSYKPDTTYTENDRKVFYWEEADFLPDRNIMIKFSKTE